MLPTTNFKGGVSQLLTHKKYAQELEFLPLSSPEQALNKCTD